MKYDTPYRQAALTECRDSVESFYHAINEKEDDAKLMSSAAYDVVGRAISDWLKTPGILSCKLDVEEQTLELYIASPIEEEDLATFTLPFAELVRATARTCQSWDGLPPSDLSAMLRKLADEIDAGEQEA